jgi:hypothetical protein
MINGWDEVEFQLEDAQPGEVDLPTSPPTPAQDEIPDFHSQKPETGAAPASD